MILTQKSLFPALVKDRVTVIDSSKQLNIFDLLAVPTLSSEIRRLEPGPLDEEAPEIGETIEFDGLKIRVTESGAELL